MSLIAHWPLNGNTNDIVNGISMTTVTASISTTVHKLGGGYTFTSGDSISTTSGITLGTDISISGWGYLTSSSGNFMLFSTNSPTYSGVDLYFTGPICWNTGDGSSNPFKDDGGTNVPYPSINAWHHYVVTTNKNNNKAYLYIDGIYKGSATYKSPEQTNAGFTIGNYEVGVSTGYYWPGTIEDVRIYNHQLSAKEIYLLAQAKILHYTFNNFEEETDNLLSTTAMTMTPDVTTGITIGSDSLGDYFIKDTNVAAWYHGLRIVNNNTNVLTSGVTYTVSMELMSPSPSSFSISYDANATGGDWSGNDAGRISNVGAFVHNGTSTYDTPCKWLKYEFTVVMKTWTGGTTAYAHDSFFPTTNGIQLYYRNLQFELKNGSTEYIDGTRNNQIYDSSGYGYHPILYKNYIPIKSDETGIGSSSYKGPGKTDIYLYNTDVPELSDSFTFSCWVNQQNATATYSDTTTTTSQFIMSHGRDVAPYGANIRSTNGTVQVLYGGSGGSGTITGSSIMNGWHHVVFTFIPGTGGYLYVDGDLSASNTTVTTMSYTQASGAFVIGKMSYTYTSDTRYFPFDGYISDVRIYATALSATDIKSLYEQKASVDNIGNIYSNEINSRNDVGYLLNDAINNKTFTNGLSSYQQTYCQCTLTDDGYRIFRHPHIVYETFTTTNASTNLTAGDTSSLQVGMEVVGTGIPASTTISSITDGTSLVLNNAATATGTTSITFTRNSTSSTWGGMVWYLPDDAKIVGHKYRFRFKIKGQTSNSMSDRRIAYTTGWSSYGIGLPSRDITVTKLSNMTDFNESQYQIFEGTYEVNNNKYDYGTWNSVITSGSNVVTYYDKHVSAPDVTNGDMLVFGNGYFPDGTTITGVTSDVSFTVSNNATASSANTPLQTYRVWDTYRQLKIGFTYTLTGVLGTDLYIKDLQILDITDDVEVPISISENYIFFVDNLSNVGIVDHTLVGYYPLKNNSEDVSENLYDGTDIGTIKYNGNSTEFSGAITDYISLPTGLIASLGDFTFMYNAKFTNVSKSLNTVFHATSTGGNTLSLEHRETYFRTFINDSVSPHINYTISNNIDYHFAIVRNDTQLTMYVNGVAQTPVTTVNTTITIPGTGAIVLGQEQDAIEGSFDATQSFEGSLSNFKIFNRALSAEEIAIEADIFNSDRKMKQHEDGTLYISGGIYEGL